LTKHDAQLMSV